MSYEELRNMPSETRVATLECAGNSRVFLVPQVQGAQWELGAVSNAEWTGVPLRALLERAGEPCNLKPQQRDLTPVLRRPVEPAKVIGTSPRALRIYEYTPGAADQLQEGHSRRRRVLDSGRQSQSADARKF